MSGALDHHAGVFSAHVLLLELGHIWEGFTCRVVGLNPRRGQVWGQEPTNAAVDSVCSAPICGSVQKPATVPPAFLYERVRLRHLFFCRGSYFGGLGSRNGTFRSTLREERVNVSGKGRISNLSAQECLPSLAGTSVNDTAKFVLLVVANCCFSSS